jgi:hypothetical protein
VERHTWIFNKKALFMLTLFAKIIASNLPLFFDNHDEIRIIRDIEARGLIRAKFAPLSKGRETYGQERLAQITGITPLGMRYYIIHSTLGNKYAGYMSIYP